jgi:hypothetical protein
MILRPRWHNALADQSRTITRTGDRTRAREGEKPFLFLALQCDRPLSSRARFGFAGPDAVSIDESPQCRSGVSRRLRGRRQVARNLGSQVAALQPLTPW